MDLKEQDLLGEDIARHWYYRAKSAALRRLVRGLPNRHILDVGAGSGFFSRELLARTPAREATCVDTGYLEDRDEWVAGKPIRFRRESREADADLVLLMDVLEHVRDDRGLLTDCALRARNRTHFIVTVPAFDRLWSGHDVFLGHERRYTLPEVEALVASAGLEVATGAYFFGLVFPLAAARRLVRGRVPADEPRSDLGRHWAPVNAALFAACRLELPFMRWNRLAGLTVCCLARKP
jgi:SAM-dependent methyltransferase